MKKIAIPFLALAICALPVGAMAASLGVNANAATNTTVTAGNTSTSLSTNTGASVNGSLSNKSNFSDVVGTLSDPKTSASIDFTTIQTKHIKFVLVSKLTGYSATGLSVSAADLKNRAALDANVAADATLTAALKKKGYSPTDVVAVSTNAKGDLTVFIAK